MSRLTALLLAIAVPTAHALEASDLSDMEGWTITAVTNVRDDFEGCDFDKGIQFDNGWTLTCTEYSYSYSYHPDAVVFAKVFPFKGQNYWMIKVLIDDEFYEMQPIPAK